MEDTMNVIVPNVDAYLAFCSDRGVTEDGLAIVREIITSPPARRVNTRSMSANYTSRFPSRKMGFTIQAESRSLELASVYLKEFDPAVKGYWDQPSHRPNLVYFSGDRRVRVPVTLDYFVIADEFIGFEECKPVEILKKLCANRNERYHWNAESAAWEIPSLRDYLDGTSLGHRVVCEEQINSTYVENLALLYDFLDQTVTDEDMRIWIAAQRLLEIQGAVTIEELEQSVSGLTRKRVMTAIALGRIHTNLCIERLVEPERVTLFASLEAAQSSIEPKPRLKLGEGMLNGSSHELGVALDRYQILEKLEKGADLRLLAESQNVSVRTVQRWRNTYKEHGLHGLQPKHAKRGNFGSKLPFKVESCINEIIAEYYLNSQARTRFHVYQLLRARCEEIGIHPPSRQAFYERLNALSDKLVLKTREGAKRAYQVTGYEGVEGDRYEPVLRSVRRYLERCHIDHTQVDLQLVSLQGTLLGKPWLTLIVDEFTGFVLSVYLSFRNPNSASLMCAIRLMVMEHEVFPQAIVVDGGKEFESIYFETLMARYRCTIVSRKGKPKAGGAVERVFGENNSILLDNLAGNNKLAKKIRQVSASHNPQNLAVWEPLDFYHVLLSFIRDRNTKSVSSGGLSSAEIRDVSIKRFGVADTRKVAYNSTFLRDTLPSPKRKTVNIRRNQSIQVNRVAYWHSSLRSAPIDGVSCEVRYDPFDLNYVFVLYKKEWLKFRSTQTQHKTLDDLDMAVIAEVSRESLAVHDKNRDTGRLEIAQFIEHKNAEAVAKSLERGDRLKTISDEIRNDDSSNGEFSIADNLWEIEIPESTELR